MVVLPAFGCVLPGNDGETHTGNDTTGGPVSDTTTVSTTQSGGDPSTSSSEGADGTVGTSTSGDDDDTTTGAHPLTNCIDATVALGNPYYAGPQEGWNPAGQGVHDDPPIPNLHLAASDDGVYIDTQREVWFSDGRTVRRVAGNDGLNEYRPNGACDDIRLLAVEGIAALPDGRVVIADAMGNGIIELTDPTGECTAATIAGNGIDTQISDFEDVAYPGDVDGPGVTAMFYSPRRPVADAQGNIYVNDFGNAKIKMIADDAERTVTTLAEYPHGQAPFGMTVMNGTVYVVGANGTADFIWAIDTNAPGEIDVVYEGLGLFDEVQNAQALLFAAANDGVDLLLASSKGYVFRVSTDGLPLATVAGIGQVVDFPEDLDLSMPVPVAELPLSSYGSGRGDLLRRGNDLLFTGNADGSGWHVWDIRCE
ncbi:MAG: hypothetical protein IPH07_12660 [Deltaproteobacteria bacterium]|nr:hypothetical protein [Deltaproteobacteria bacterium]MBK8241360.1 hypothetical protein [Deltaproteobacteria bacterium]MBK8717076.1 hypothetical protein [Deltaproteobacteria bacterium]MBP7286401.1 hypothetical protein [Nannocystaceae bacterium]